MRRFTLFTFCLGLALCVIQTSATVQAQPPAASQSGKTIGLIDMAHLFKEYKKFDDLRVQLRNDIKASDEQAKKMGEALQSLQKQLKGGTFKEGSDEYSKREADLIAKSTQFDVFRKTQQREFLRRESKVYKEVYLEVVGAVGKYAEFYNYDVIVRFSRSAVDETDNAQELIQNMNRQVVWHNESIDITEKVLAFLNQQYAETARTATAPGNPQK